MCARGRNAQLPRLDAHALPNPLNHGVLALSELRPLPFSHDHLGYNYSIGLSKALFVVNSLHNKKDGDTAHFISRPASDPQSHTGPSATPVTMTRSSHALLSVP